MTRELERFAHALTLLAPAEGGNPTALPDVHCVRFDRPGMPHAGTWRQSLCIVAQGQKELALGSELYRYDAGQYVVASIDLPVTTRVVAATPAHPFLCLRLELEPIQIAQIAARMPGAPSPTSAPRGLFVASADAALLTAATRLVTLLATAVDDIPVLAPLILKELVYWLLKSPCGDLIRPFATPGEAADKIRLAAQVIREHGTRPLEIDELAQRVGMSRSVFYANFREVTALSPIQYQKRLRLLEARQLILAGDANIEGAAYRVGYRSPSQFSRDYVRLFKRPPSIDRAGRSDLREAAVDE